MEKMHMSPVKRERIKKEQQKRRKIEMRAALPVLTREEIRRYRLPHDKALLEELMEGGYINSREFLEELINYQQHLRELEGPGSAMWYWPELVNEVEHLDKIYEVLKKAENAHFKNNIEEEFDEMMDLAVFYAFGAKIWWWLGEQLLIQCIHICMEYTADGRQREALSRYVFGKFLLDNKNCNESAKEHLLMSRKISKGMSWSAKKVLKIEGKQQNIFTESCYLLYNIHENEAKNIKYSDPQAAAKLASLARKRATDACDREKEADALMLQGICLLEANNPRAAAVCFFKSLVINERLGKHAPICQARINLAVAYIKVDNFEDAIKHLEALKNYAEANDLPYYIGQTYRYLGEYYINQGQPQLAQPILAKAVIIFHNMNFVYESLQVNNLAAVAKGQLLLKKYVHLIIRCGSENENNNSHLMQLVSWKDIRVPFWNDEEEDRNSLESILSMYKVHEKEAMELDMRVSKMRLNSFAPRSDIGFTPKFDEEMSIENEFELEEEYSVQIIEDTDEQMEISLEIYEENEEFNVEVEEKNIESEEQEQSLNTI